MGRNKEQIEYFDTQMTNAGLQTWYDTLMKRMKDPKKYASKYSPEERDRIMKENKIGPYRTWQFDPKRWEEILEEVEDIHSKKMIKLGVSYYRSKYSDHAQFLTDEEIITRGLYKKFYQDKATAAWEYKHELQELEKNAYSQDLV